MVQRERSDRRLGRSATRVKGLRYPGASPWMTLSCQDGDLRLDSLRDAQPMEAIVGSPQVIGQPRRRVQH